MKYSSSQSQRKFVLEYSTSPNSIRIWSLHSLAIFTPTLRMWQAFRVQGIGKAVCIKKLSPSYLFDQAMSLIEILSPKVAAKDEVISAGEKALVLIYIMVKKVKLLKKYVTEYSV